METGEKILRYREKLRWSQKKLGIKSGGIRQQTINAIEKGKTRKTRYLPDIAKALAEGLGKTVAELDLGLELHAEGTLTQLQDLAVDVPHGLDLPVYGASLGPEGAMTVSVSPVEAVKRPALLASVASAYGLRVADDTMEPQLRAGHVALIHPHLPPVPNFTHVFYASESRREARICELIQATQTDWVVRSFNPRREFKLSRKSWPVCHQVVGVYYR